MLLLRGLAAFCTLLLFPVLSSADVLHARNSTGLTSAVTWDSHSLSILGQRTFVLSAEFHPWRLPNPALWADVFQKIKASGFNTVSFYVNWALHYPAPDTNGGEGDFTEGTYRDLQRFIDDAKSSGLWLIAR
jgi:beta-galactosidase GanA